MTAHHRPLGPDESWKSGQRVPYSGIWQDQFGQQARFEAGRTFPPCIDRKGTCAYRVLVFFLDGRAAATA